MPFPFATVGAGVGLSLLNALFGKRKSRHYTEGDLKELGYKPLNTAEMIANQMRIAESLKKAHRIRRNQKSAQLGLDPVADSYAGEEGIDDALFRSITDIERMGEEDKNRMADLLLRLNLENEDLSSFGSRGIEGLIFGASLGSGVDNLLTPVNEPDTTPLEDNPVENTPAPDPVNPVLESSNIGTPQQDLISPVRTLGDLDNSNSVFNLSPLEQEKLSLNNFNMFGKKNPAGMSLNQMSYLNDPLLHKYKKLFSLDKTF